MDKRSAASSHIHHRAKAYEATTNRLLLEKYILTLILLGVFYVCGASDALASGLHLRFGAAWWLSNGFYILIAIFGYAAFLFPLQLYGEYHIEQAYGLSTHSLGSWLWHFAKNLILLLLLTLTIFELLYTLIHFVPNHWWIAAALIYFLLSFSINLVAPPLFATLFRELEPLTDLKLKQSISDLFLKEHLKVEGIYHIDSDDDSDEDHIAVVGLGSSRNIIISHQLITRYKQDEVVALIARELAHDHYWDTLRLICAESFLAAVGFYVIKFFFQIIAPQWGLPPCSQINSFPILVFCLLLLAPIMMLVMNTYSRKREFAADTYAIKAIGDAAPLISTFNKAANDKFADPEPAYWIECLFCAQPSISRRIAHAERTRLLAQRH